MKVLLETSIKRYLDRVEDLLLQQEVKNNLMLGLLERGRNNIGVFSDGARLGIVEDNGEPIYAFMQTPPNKWIFPKVGHMDEKYIPAIVQFLYQHKYPVPGVIGPDKIASEFIRLWTERKGITAELTMKQMVYRLDKVKIIPDVSGKLIPASEEHLPIAKEWIYQFGLQANVQISKTQAASMAANYIQNQTLHLWEVDGDAVSMANNGRRTRNGATVNGVFTPDIHKRKGYATSIVAAFSQKLLDDGFQFCNLYTDVSNPISNSIYQKIGYYVVGDSVEYIFKR
ncbi:GNAT family N-acetyltransferase [Ornithinibacillus scapharcae]|uniref:GNAT family N-acetyltransferase n=1 Tax=Ornithinibacillus scapharcae TaxID=1147159 RepID=UPI000225AB57|nr:GNAT family N-acetyltransferase [Ornithinibacillus scapharcae]